MPSTETPRMRQIAEDLRDEGFYTAANSVDAITDERDALAADIANLRQCLHDEKHGITAALKAAGA